MPISKSISGAKKKIEDYTNDLKNRHQNGLNAAAKTFDDNRRSGNYWRSAHASNYTSPYGAGNSTMGQPKGGAKYGSQVGIAGGVNKTASNTPDYTDLRNIAKPEYTDPRTLERPEFEQGTAFNPNVDKTNVNKWRDNLEAMYEQIANRGPFEYKQNEDPLYQQYEDMYTRNAKLAMQDTVGQVAALTGGYGSSYAETAGQAMYNQAMNGLNERAIELYGLAQDRYNAETNRLQQNFANAGNMYNQAYGEMRDDLSDQRYAYEIAEEQRRERNANALQMYDYDRADLAAMNDYNLQMYNYDLQNAAAMNDYNFNLWDANNRNNQWAQEFAHQQLQDAWNNQFKQDQFDWDKYTYTNEFNYQKQQDAWNNNFKQQQFNRSVYEYDKDNDYKYDVLDYDADEAEKNRLYNSAEAEKGRLYNSAEAEKDRKYNSKQNQLDREQNNYKTKYNDLSAQFSDYQKQVENDRIIYEGNTPNANNGLKTVNLNQSKNGQNAAYNFGAYTEKEFDRRGGASVDGKRYTNYPDYVEAVLDKNKNYSEQEKAFMYRQLTK